MIKKLQFPFTVLIFVLLFANIIVLDIVFLTQKDDSTENIATGVQSPTITKPDLTEVPAQTQTVTPTSNPVIIYQNQSKSQVKDYMISLGSGTSQSSDWANVPGVGATIDSNSYGGIKAAYFEASIIMPTANNIVSLRLYNVTDKHPVWYSQIDSNGETTAFLSSQAIRLDPGSKLYQVQMKSLLTDEPVTLVQGRIHIITN